jgi:hypothetical protein
MTGKDLKVLERRLLSTNGGKRYPFAFFGIEFGIGSFSLKLDWMKKDLQKENTSYVC